MRSEVGRKQGSSLLNHRQLDDGTHREKKYP